MFKIIHKNGILIKLIECGEHAKLHTNNDVETCDTREDVNAKILELDLAVTPGQKLRKVFLSLPIEAQTQFAILYAPVTALCDAGAYTAAKTVINSIVVSPELEEAKQLMLRYLS